MKKWMLMTVALWWAAEAVFAANSVIRYDAYAVEASGGEITVKDRTGQPMLKIGRQLFSWSPPVAVPVKVEQAGPDTFLIAYEIEKDPSGDIALAGKLVAQPDGHIRLEWRLDAPSGARLGGIMQELIPVGKTQKTLEAYKSGRWTRKPQGGTPFEVRDGYYRRFGNDQTALWMLIGGNQNYTNRTSDHLRYQKQEGGAFHAALEFVVAPPDMEGFQAAALFAKRPVALRLHTDRPFNLFESGRRVLNVEAANAGSAPLRNVILQVTVRDFDGVKVLETTETIPSLRGFETREFAYALPEAERAIYFAEATLTPLGRDRVFSRTNLAILPPHEFQYRDRSVFGLSAYFAIPSEEEVYRLMQRMGVRFLRHGDNRLASRYGMVALDHANVPYEEGPDKVKQKIDSILKRAREMKNPEIEFCNEWNMNKKSDRKKQLAGHYVDVLREFIRERDARQQELKIIGMGMAGPDTEFLRLMVEAGAAPLMKGGVALHPGRGNFTPDYTGNFWSYLGAIRAYRKAMRELGVVDILHLSEVYAGTHPNHAWKDSYRAAAENVILTYAIGLAEGAASIQFYQLHDAVWHDRGGVNEKDHEYHYGLLMRDGAVKPSLLAYAAVAEQLDGASFVKYFEGKDNIKGIGFDTPRGPLAFLYDRTDGCVMWKSSPDFVHQEPWVDTWKTRITAEFETTGPEVIVIDPIGRRRTLKTVNGRVTIPLTGAPLMVYGIKF